MVMDLLEQRALLSPVQPQVPRRAVDLGYASLVLITRLRDSLLGAVRLLDRCRQMADKAARGSATPLFFFDRTLQAEWQAAQRKRPQFPEPFLTAVASQYPAEVLAWRSLPELLDDVHTLMCRVEVRRAARAADGLIPVLLRMTADLPAAGRLAAILTDVVDDASITVIQPATGQGVQLLATGVADIAQLDVLLQDYWLNRKLDRRIVSAYQSGNPHPNTATVMSRWQFYRPAGLQPDGSLAGVQHWCHTTDSLAQHLRQNPERVLYVGEAIVPRQWAVGRVFPMVEGELDVLRRLDRAEVQKHLSARCPLLPPPRALSRVA